AGLMGERDEILADLGERARYLESLTSLGLPRAAKAAAAARPPVATPGEAGEDLGGIRSIIGDCRRCKLANGRKNIGFGQGNPHARLMFVGEAPGADEDEQGLAFVGRAGQLLTKIIEAIGLRRGGGFCAKVLKGRPPRSAQP